MVSAENIGDLYDRAARVFEADVTRRYWLQRIAAEPAARASGRVEIIAPASHAEVVNQVATAAQARVSELLTASGRAIGDLPAARQVAYWA